MYEYMNLPGELSSQDIEHLVEQLSQITLPDGRKPFTVEVVNRPVHHEIHLHNEAGVAVLAFRKAPEWKE